jgi:adhesin transport system outer membrane protein
MLSLTARRLLLTCSMVGLLTAGAQAQSLREAVSLTLKTNPQIGAAIENKEAIAFELRQARGLFMPRVDFEASAGRRELERLGGASATGQTRYSPIEAGVTATWKLFDGGSREAEVDRQASRVDGAAIRVLERSEFLALEVTREYLETILQRRLVSIAEKNVAFLSDTLSRIRANVSSGSLTDADLRQGEERVLSARARLIEARQELSAAHIRFNRLVGINLTRPSTPASMASRIPKSVDAALGLATRNNPRLQIASAEIDAASALVRAARSKLAPEFFLEARGRVGRDVDGVVGRTNDAQGRAVMRWNLYNGGIDVANIEEQNKRVAEAQFLRDQVLREIREQVKLSFDRRARQAELSAALSRQLSAGDRVVSAYNDQFAVGRRSLLDLLDAQNTRYNAEVLLETARTSALFAEYRVLAATGQLVKTLGLQPSPHATAYARADANVPPTSTADILQQRSPPPPGARPWLPQGALQ